MRIFVAGAGAWGTALAMLLEENGHAVTLWTRNAEKAWEIDITRQNPALAGVTLPAGIRVTAELAEAEELFRHPLHPYTRALLSAVPNPNPYLERSKKLLVYDPSVHDYSVDKPEWCEILPDHFVYGNAPELDGYRKELGL